MTKISKAQFKAAFSGRTVKNISFTPDPMRLHPELGILLELLQNEDTLNLFKIHYARKLERVKSSEVNTLFNALLGIANDIHYGSLRICKDYESRF